LHEYLKLRRCVEPAEARVFLFVVLNTLKFLQVKNIAHRDIKPENIFLRSTENISDCILADFGFASVCNGRSLSTYCGSAAYVAPEVVRTMTDSLQCYDYRCDCWSVGILAFEMLMGDIPFVGKDEKTMLRHIRRGEFHIDEQRWNKLPRDARQVVEALLTVDEFSRPTASQALELSWFAGMEWDGEPWTPDSPPSVSPAPSKAVPAQEAPAPTNAGDKDESTGESPFSFPSFSAPSFPTPFASTKDQENGGSADSDADAWGLDQLSEKLQSLPDMFQSIFEETRDSLFSPQGSGEAGADKFAE